MPNTGVPDEGTPVFFICSYSLFLLLYYLYDLRFYWI